MSWSKAAIFSMLTWLIVLAPIWPLLWVIRWLFTARLVMGLEFRATQVLER